MSNHFTGLNLGPPEGDTRLDLTDLYVFQAPTDATRTVVILNCNSFAKGAAFHPDAVYRINIDNDGDLETDVALILVFSQPRDGRQQGHRLPGNRLRGPFGRGRRGADLQRRRGVVRSPAANPHVGPLHLLPRTSQRRFFHRLRGHPEYVRL